MQKEIQKKTRSPYPDSKNKKYGKNLNEGYGAKDGKPFLVGKDGILEHASI